HEADRGGGTRRRRRGPRPATKVPGGGRQGAPPKRDAGVTMRRTLFLLLLALLAACAKSKDSAPAPGPAPSGPEEINLDQATAGLAKDGKLMAEFVTDLGSIHCELLPEAAPQTVASFVGLARGVKPFLDPSSQKWVKKPFYDGLAFHRVIARFMIQGGD